MEKEMKDKIRAFVSKGVKYRDLTHFVIVACDRLIREEEAAKAYSSDLYPFRDKYSS
jgi:hypothetical protein